jgi:hypothetical protein
MASTYSQYKLELIGTGEQAGTWGVTTNANLGGTGGYQGIEQAIGGKATIDLSAGGTIALTLTNSNAAQDARALFFDLGGSPGGAVTLQVPAIQKSYIVKNGSGQTVTVEISGGTGVAVPDGSTTVVYADGTNVVDAVTHLSSLTLGTALPVASGGTGVTASTGTTAVVLSTSPTLVTPLLGTPTSGTLSNCTVDGTVAVGFRNIPQSGAAKTTSYILATGDVGKLIEVGSGGSIEVPNATFAAGDAVVIFNNTSGSITLTMSITTSFIGGTDADDDSISLATRGVCNILFISGTVCVVTGNVT